MLLKLNFIIVYSLIAFFVSFMLYPLYINILIRLKFGKNIREDAVSGEKAEIFNQLHQHKKGTPTMGGGIFLLVVLILVIFSMLLPNFYGEYIKHSLFSQQETYILLFAFFSMGILGLIDDILNIKGIGRTKGLTAKMKLLWMFLFAGFISYWFYYKLNIHYLNIWPLNGEIDLNYGFILITFFLTICIVNAINITDGLDGLAGGLILFVLAFLGFITFYYKWYLATTLIGIIGGVICAFLWFNINPAKIYMGDSGALALGGFVSALVYLINIKMGIMFPFFIIFTIFFCELGTSFLQITWKKFFHKKLFAIAPLHHLLEYHNLAEYTIVMKLWLIQGVLTCIAVILIVYQIYN